MRVTWDRWIPPSLGRCRVSGVTWLGGNAHHRVPVGAKQHAPAALAATCGRHALDAAPRLLQRQRPLHRWSSLWPTVITGARLMNQMTNPMVPCHAMERVVLSAATGVAASWSTPDSADHIHGTLTVLQTVSAVSVPYAHQRVAVSAVRHSRRSSWMIDHDMFQTPP